MWGEHQARQARQKERAAAAATHGREPGATGSLAEARLAAGGPRGAQRSCSTLRHCPTRRVTEAIAGTSLLDLNLAKSKNVFVTCMPHEF